MKAILDFLWKRMELPKQFGALHIIALLCVAAFSFVLCFFFRNAKEKTYRRILIVIWAVMVVMELIGEFQSTFSVAEDGSISFRYQIEYVPLQLCDMPFYFLLPIAFMKDGKARDALSAYMCSYILLGGLIALIFASTILTDVIFLNVHTLAHHGLQVAVCAFIGVYNRRRLSLRTFIPAVIIFLISVVFVTAYNVGMHALFPNAYINLFYISPYFRKTVPFLNSAFQKMHWLPVIFMYIGVVSALAFIVYGLYRLIVYLVFSRSERVKR